MEEYLLFLGILLIIIICFILYYNNNNKKNIIDNVLTTIKDTFSQKIPKIIIQTWKNNEIPTKYLPLINTIKNLNPDYEYKFFTDQDIEIFLKTYYNKYYRTYLSLPIKIQKIDFFRYIAVYHYGGFYMDLDMNAIKNFDELLPYSCVFPVDEIINKNMSKLPRYKPFCDKNYYYLLGQYAFAASPKHPFIKKLIDNIHNNIHQLIYNANKSEIYVYKSTGPDYVTDIYINYNDKADIKILHNNKRQYFGDYAVHNYFGSWKNNKSM